ncbi:hypothetical protein K7X08_014401 [Anisodus acutangulus]|uniref:Calcineurin-like phosphoesterase domain-containing protein n=1 Tax=Anisodus acutangulus TaxID=402998 RepID=A0A9Q1LL48_9SOLA|nr:hypothetical protein K7X08_014401 [Anisodus acutangulus]
MCLPFAAGNSLTTLPRRIYSAVREDCNRRVYAWGIGQCLCYTTAFAKVENIKNAFPTIFIGGNHDASNYLWELQMMCFHTTVIICPNLFLLLLIRLLSVVKIFP